MVVNKEALFYVNVKKEDTKGDHAIKEEADVEDYDEKKAEDNSSSSEMRVNPAETTIPALAPSELDITPVAHSGVWCDGCNVPYFLTSHFTHYL